MQKLLSFMLALTALPLFHLLNPAVAHASCSGQKGEALKACETAESSMIARASDPRERDQKMAQAKPISDNGLTYLNANEAMKICDKIFRSIVKKPGQIILDIQIDSAGVVLRAAPDLKASSIRNPKLVNCVVDTFKGHTLAMEASGQEKTLSATFRFPRTSDQ